MLLGMQFPFFSAEPASLLSSSRHTGILHILLSDVLWHAPLPLSIVITITGFTTTPAALSTMDVFGV